MLKWSWPVLRHYNEGIKYATTNIIIVTETTFMIKWGKSEYLLFNYTWMLKHKISVKIFDPQTVFFVGIYLVEDSIVKITKNSEKI
jgi:hypothetical protein